MASGVSTEGVRALALMRWRLKAMAAAVRGLCSPPPGVERSDQSSAQPDLPPAAACGQSRLAPLKAGARSNRRAFSTDTDADLRVPGCAAYFAYADAAGNSDESAGNVPSTNPVGAGATALPPARAAAPRSRCSPTALPLTPTPAPAARRWWRRRATPRRPAEWHVRVASSHARARALHRTGVSAGEAKHFGQQRQLDVVVQQMDINHLQYSARTRAWLRGAGVGGGATMPAMVRVRAARVLRHGRGAGSAVRRGAARPAGQAASTAARARLSGTPCPCAHACCPWLPPARRALHFQGLDPWQGGGRGATAARAAARSLRASCCLSFGAARRAWRGLALSPHPPLPHRGSHVYQESS